MACLMVQPSRPGAVPRLTMLGSTLGQETSVIIPVFVSLGCWSASGIGRVTLTAAARPVPPGPKRAMPVNWLEGPSHSTSCPLPCSPTPRGAPSLPSLLCCCSRSCPCRFTNGSPRHVPWRLPHDVDTYGRTPPPTGCHGAGAQSATSRGSRRTRARLCARHTTSHHGTGNGVQR